MKIGVISAYPDEDWDARRIADAAARRGDVRVHLPTDFAAEVPRVTACGIDVREYAVFLTPRALGELGDAEAQVELYRAISEQGVPVVNDVSALFDALDKFRTSWLLALKGVPTPPAVLVQDLGEALRAVENMGRAVLKPLYGSLGRGVELVLASDVERLSARLARRGVLYLQKFVAAPLDVRALVVGGEVVAAMARRPRPGEFRSNLDLGAEARPIELDPDARACAIRAAAALGLAYAGVDLLIGDDGPLVLEVNGTPSFRGLERATRKDVAQAIVDHAVFLSERCDGDGAQTRRGHGRRSGPSGRRARRAQGRPGDPGPVRRCVI